MTYQVKSVDSYSLDININEYFNEHRGHVTMATPFSAVRFCRVSYVVWSFAVRISLLSLIVLSHGQSEHDVMAWFPYSQPITTWHAKITPYLSSRDCNDCAKTYKIT